jgi:hypothetical protein
MRSTVRLFADDCIIYTPIVTAADAVDLQYDVSRLCNWCEAWNMELNTKKCSHISFTNRRRPLKTNYTFGNNPIVSVKTCKYLGLTFQSNLSWNSHINTVVSKALSSLYFIQRNHKFSSSATLELLYKTLVRPIVEYGSSIWDPHHTLMIHNLDRVQRRAARLVCKRFDRRTSVTALLLDLNWDTLTQRRKISRLCNFYKISASMGQGGWEEFSSRMADATYYGRHDHAYKVKICHSRIDLHLYSFFIRTSRDWNALPESVFQPLPLSVKQFRDNLKSISV